MSPPRPALADVRQRIDRVDQQLLDLIAERLSLSADVRRAKAGAKLWRPMREDEHVAELIDRARDSATPPALVSRVWAELMSASISVQGSTCLHVALEGDTRSNIELIRDRFGGSLPVRSYPTSSTALAACYADTEGIAVLPAPGGMIRWWTALTRSGAMPDLKIVAALPRVDAKAWPHAVAVATMDLDGPADNDKGRWLICADREGVAAASGTVRAESDGLYLAEVAAPAIDLGRHDVIGCLPRSVTG